MEVFYSIMFFILGSVLASFYCVLATRLPEGKSIVRPGSHCEHCNHPLKWYELIPIFSYLFLRGKCRACHKRIPVYEFICEIITGLLFMLSYWHFGLSYSFWVSLFLISLLILIFVSDFKYMIILDSPLVITSLAIFGLKVFYFDLETALYSLLDGVLLFLFMLFIAFLGKKIFKREALGGGDIKLSFVIGLTVGLPYGFMVLVLSTFLALPYATFSLLTNSSHEVPYGPFLISALCIVFLYYEKFSYILNLFS